MKSASTRPTFTLTTLSLLTGALPAAAHDGHGLAGSHWHATDAWGLIALGGVILLAVWLSRGK